MDLYEPTLRVEPVITKEDYKDILTGASDSESTPLFIAATPDGVFQYDLSLLKLGFENYADHSAGIDVVCSRPRYIYRHSDT
jgi:hypothetical protein